MSDRIAATLHDLISLAPEHKVPYAGDVVRLDYDPARGPVGVRVESDALGFAVFTVTVPEDEAMRSMDLARRALVRSTGNDPDDPQSVSRARGRMGAMAFADGVNRFARQRMFSLAVMRTRILPFLAPQYLSADGPRPGHDYTFQVRVRLRPRARLTSYGPVEVVFPARPEVGEHDVDVRLSAMMGGDVRWDQVPDDARPAFDGLRARAREQLEAERETAWRGMLADACSDVLADRLAAAPDRRYVELLRDEMANRFAAGVEADGTPWDRYIAAPDFDMEGFRASMTRNAEEALRRGLALDAMADHENIQLDEDDVLAAVALVSQGRDREAAQAMLDGGQLPQLCEVARRAKTSEWVASRAVEVSPSAGV